MGKWQLLVKYGEYMGNILEIYWEKYWEPVIAGKDWENMVGKWRKMEDNWDTNNHNQQQTNLG